MTQTLSTGVICPNEATSVSPELAHRAYRGSTSQNDYNPNGVESSGALWTQPFQVWERAGLVPRVAAAPGPWTGRWNPVGIRETATAGTAE